MKYFFAILFPCFLLASCQRKTAVAVEESKTVEVKKAPANTKTLGGTDPTMARTQKDLNSKDSLKTGEVKDDQPRIQTDANYKALYESGYQKHNAGDFQGAIADFSKCISMNPEFSDAYNFRGMSKYKSGDNAGACSDWNKALGLGYVQAQRTISLYCK